MDVLIVSILLSFASAFVSVIAKILLKFISDEPVNSELRREIIETRRVLNTISITEEFAKYAKLERKLNSLQDQLKKDVQNKFVKRMKLKATIVYSLQALLLVCSVGMFWCWRLKVVVSMPAQWLSPLDTLLSWPLDTPGAISFPVWFLTANSVAKLIAKPFV